ncbi:MAG: hypothetical protein M1829_003962 [Trizodia sp. TS-e1964]|nr:MAG: hypothetical protein M1829_003962 [Trizodia sp. TS-e1964]
MLSSQDTTTDDGNNNNNNNSKTDSPTQQSTSTTAAPPAKTDSTSKSNNSPSTTADIKSTDSNTGATSKTDGKTTTTQKTSTSSNSIIAVITPTGKTSTDTAAPPTRTTSSSSTRASITGSGVAGGGELTGLPTLAAAYKYPAPTVPPTTGAPFMQKSKLPEGTVFIVVGAFLGGLALAVVAWRGLVAWSLHRSVKRAAQQQSYADSKAMLRPPTAGFYSAGAPSTNSVDRLSTINGAARRGEKSHTPSVSLFYSPTAATGGVGMGSMGNRGSSYHPAGYYAAGNSTPGGAANMALAAGRDSINLSNLGPNSHNYSRSRSIGATPPASPGLTPYRGSEAGHARTSGIIPHHASTSSLNLSAPPQGRAPSAYLEDLFTNHAPGQAPNRASTNGGYRE